MRILKKLFQFRKFVVVIVLTLLTCFSYAQENKKNVNMDKFINDLLKKMTLEEKIGQLNLLPVGTTVTGPKLTKDVEQKIQKGLVGNILNIYTPDSVKKLQDIALKKSRLKIPMIFGFDVIHGHRSIFPIPLALASSWNMELIKKSARAAAREAARDGLHWVYSPMVDIVRDPRWGRVMESSGEDPYLGSEIARAMVRGYQKSENEFLAPDGVLACVKHFALYGASEAGRDYNTVDMSRLRMFNEYFPPYKAAIEENVASVMTSFNEVDSIPASGNKWLLTNVLREMWGFKGFVTSDYSSINEMKEHGMGDDADVVKLAFNASVDMDMAGELYLKELPRLIQEKKITIQQIDIAVKRVLEAKWKLQLFKNPYANIELPKYSISDLLEENKTLAKETAIQSMVLLKNENKILPLDSNKKIAFIGPFVKDAHQQLGAWRAAGDKKDSVSLWSALEQFNNSKSFLYAKGANFTDDQELIKFLNIYDGQLEYENPELLLQEALEVAKKSEVIVAVLGEPFGVSGEAASRTNLDLFPNQKLLLNELKKLGKPIVLVLYNGRPLTLEWEEQYTSAILEAWFSGIQTGPALADILFGKANPSGKLTMTFPRNVGQIPIYYNAKNTGRPYLTPSIRFAEKYKSKYLDVTNEPLYSFGYGLSYSQFEYGNVTLENSKVTPGLDHEYLVKVPVKNVSSIDGYETIMLFIQHGASDITHPIKELKQFKKLFFKANEEKVVEFKLDKRDLVYYNSQLNQYIKKGRYSIFINSLQKLTFEYK